MRVGSSLYHLLVALRCSRVQLTSRPVAFAKAFDGPFAWAPDEIKNVAIEEHGTGLTTVLRGI